MTELLGTDLHRLLTSRPLEKQFIQYFLYQILVCPRQKGHAFRNAAADGSSGVSNTFIQLVSSTAISSPATSSSTRTATSKYATSAWLAYRTLK